MSSALHGRMLARRVFEEHRVIVLSLVALAIANAAIFGLVVYPLSQRVANVEMRTRAANDALAAARREQARAAGALEAQARAAERLETFYASVLPADLTAARALFVPRVWEMSVRLGLAPRSMNWDPPAGDRLTRFSARMPVVGRYADARALIGQLETVPEFVIIDDVQLQGASGEEDALQFRFGLSTYYRSEAR